MAKFNQAMAILENHFGKPMKKLYEEESAIIPKHPILGKIKPEQWRAFHAWHAAHHLSFLHPKGETENSD